MQRPWNPPPPQEILKLSMDIIVLSQVLDNNLVPDCVRSNLRGSKFLGGLAPSPPRRHACLHRHTTIILLPSCSPPPLPQLKILYVNLTLEGL